MAGPTTAITGPATAQFSASVRQRPGRETCGPAKRPGQPARHVVYGMMLCEPPNLAER